MTHHVSHVLRFALSAALVALFPTLHRVVDAPDAKLQPFLHYAEVVVLDYLDYGRHRVVLFDSDNIRKFERRIPTGGLDRSLGKPMIFMCVCACAANGRL